jgi:POT family proton-dependent oligopeptide transporter
MAFHQNGLTLTYFADEFTQKTSTGVQSMAFNVWNLVTIIIMVYALFSVFQSKKGSNKLISGLILLAGAAFLYWQYTGVEGEVAVSAPIFQQFNPFYVVALTPVSLAIFGALAKKGKEPSAPRKIALGMIIAAVGFAVMAYGSLGLPTPEAQKALGEGGEFVSANWLISTYLVLTFAELLLSPMGISFVSKVAPPKLKGMMMGGWFVATALGNMLVSVGGFLWGGIDLWIVWTVFIVLCLLSAVFMFAMMKRLEKVC